MAGYTEGPTLHHDEAPWPLMWEQHVDETCTEHTDVELMQHGAQRPCRGRNTNVCVAEGCYGEACIREESRR